MMTFEILEQVVVQRIQTFFPAPTRVVVAQWPETSIEFQKQVNDTRVYVQCAAAEYGDIRDTGIVHQDVVLQINVVILASKLRGQNYLWAVERLTRKALLGFQPRDTDNNILSQKLFIKKGDLVNGSEFHHNTWYYQQQFYGRSQVIEQPDETEPPPTLVEIIVNTELGTQTTTSYESIDGGTPATIFEDEISGGTP